jgi:hypothetical protein
MGSTRDWRRPDGFLSATGLRHIVGLGVESISEQWLRCRTRALLLALIPRDHLLLRRLGRLGPHRRVSVSSSQEPSAKDANKGAAACTLGAMTPVGACSTMLSYSILAPAAATSCTQRCWPPGPSAWWPTSTTTRGAPHTPSASSAVPSAAPTSAARSSTQAASA